MKLKVVMIVALLFLVLPLISAQKVYVKQYEPTILPVPCTINGDYCSPAAICKTTIINPNKKILYNNYTMTRNNAVFEINLSGNDTSITGDYQFSVVCSDAGKTRSNSLEFEVNPTGDNRGIGLFLVLVISSLFVLLLGFLLKNEYIGFFSGLLFIMSGVYSFIYGIGDLADLYTRGIAFACIGLGVLFEIAAAMSAIDNDRAISIMGDDW